jgi:hypothetical protein
MAMAGLPLAGLPLSGLPLVGLPPPDPAARAWGSVLRPPRGAIVYSSSAPTVTS